MRGKGGEEGKGVMVKVLFRFKSDYPSSPIKFTFMESENIEVGMHYFFNFIFLSLNFDLNFF